jgi:hypothetical protein
MGNVAVKQDKPVDAYAGKRCDAMMKRVMQYEKKSMEMEDERCSERRSTVDVYMQLCVMEDAVITACWVVEGMYVIQIKTQDVTAPSIEPIK